MTENKDELITALNNASQNAVNAAASLHYEAEELDRSVKQIRSVHEINETIESITILAASIKTAEANLKALRQRFCI